MRAKGTDNGDEMSNVTLLSCGGTCLRSFLRNIQLLSYKILLSALDLAM